MPAWTPEQEKAIYTSGKDILVAAAAGSGKTAVLVERIIQKLLNKDNPTDIDSLLVVTFTKAAAQEMRNRVGEALEEALQQNPESVHLKKQLSLLQRASISTLHSFCMDVVRQYAYLLDLDPQFRITDDIEADLIRQDIIESLFEEWYGQEGEEREAFFEVVDRFSSDRSDVEVEQLMMQVYQFAMQNPYPEQWMQDVVQTYQIQPDATEADFPWLTQLKKEVKSQLQSMLTDAEQALHITRESDGPYQYAEAIDDDKERFQQALAHLTLSWHDLQTFMEQSASLKRLSSKKSDCSEDKKEAVKALRESYKKRWQKLAQGWLSRSLPAHIQDMRTLAPVVAKLMELVKEFHRRYQQKKKEQALVDFADLEHFCLQLLMDEQSTPDNIIPSEVAKGYQRQFTELLVDEYQDTNLVQETIIRLISGEAGGDVFMVGDVKQSIYRFRHAEPSLFLAKYKQFAEESHPAERIDLARNFRSRHEVLAGTNYIFRQILDEEVGEMTYDKDAELIYSNTIYDEVPSNDAEAELVIIDRESGDESSIEDEEGLQDLEKAQIEARAYVTKIKEWLGHEEKPALQVVDKGTGMKRSLQYRDIVILQRSMTWAPTIVEELKQQGIPVYAELASGYFEAIEIKIMLSLLKVVDNPQQDIPLAAVLRSPIVGLNEEELATIRLVASNNRTASTTRENFYEALKLYRRFGEDTSIIQKVEHFLNQLDRWRGRARQGSLSELIWQMYRETGYYDFIGGIAGGRQRQANLRALYDRARSYEATSFRGLFRFLRFIERMEERGDDLGAARALGEQEDVVRIMTIHKSKGLEFPVVIVGGMDKQFNDRDLKSRYLLHKDLGFATKYIDPEKRIMYPTLMYHALQKEKHREMLAEEMRVLYVALTRAKEKLVMIGTVASLEKKNKEWKKWMDHGEWVLPASYRLQCKSYVDWVAPALIRHKHGELLREELPIPNIDKAIFEDESNWRITTTKATDYLRMDGIDAQDHEVLEQAIKQWQPLHLNQDEKEEVNRRLSYQYLYQKAIHHRAKQSVTELKRQREVADEYSANTLIAKQQPKLQRPRFMQENQRLTAAEKGTAMHAVMQHLPFERVLTVNEVAEYVEQLVEKEFITRDQADAIDILAIQAFYETKLGARFIAADRIYREVPFTLALPANEVYADWKEETEEKVFIQGVIDCIIPHETGYIIVDYKSDQITEPVDELMEVKLMKRYQTQLSLYAEALERIWRKPVQEKYLYYFNGPCIIRVE
ncbi:helicase-exonuclease AddAB subunit AddA [Pontibacillus litoralis]|uniref:ATP-dependent helicase/nuclease subunit A n=1 Tax=Pontibacillus litoralis JSM 072002 TaxID=1385512 RepID=A0A0A5HVX9_9BACI|nr:helicase-exonuclease AddAB subunit AddA [Pontibacillus litoralis]KGX87797.1 ATP-dependent helicase [Pontibacillus litoralis JSM 072002]